MKMQSHYHNLKKFQYSTALPLFLMLTDAFVIYCVTKGWYQLDAELSSSFAGTQNIVFVLLSLSWVISGLIASTYQVEHLGTFEKIYYYSANTGLLYAILLFSLKFTQVLPSFSWVYLGLLFLSTGGAVVLGRSIMLHVYRYYRNLPFNKKPCIVIGTNPTAINLYRYFQNNSLPQSFQGFFDDQYPENQKAKDWYLGSLEDVQAYCLEKGIKEIYYTKPNNKIYLNELQDFAEKHFIYLGIVPDLDSDEKRKIDAQLFDDGKIPVISFRNTPLRLIVNAQIKRLFDIVFSFLVLFILSASVFPVIALLIKISSPGPVFFRQLRPGRNNRLFWCYKFRTMKVNNQSETQATKNDTRITRIGAFLRKTSLDELPQFYNVLIGDMSVVGPRPNMQNQLVYYSEHIPEYPIRHTISPGITGYAQVSGYRGETKELYLMQKRVEYDLEYMQNWSLSLDIKIIGLTVWNIIKGEETAY
ncbi:exopolysaccharide biosynthesis polyprenyl glycosylphosphotransferase [Porifericola rhodea]|uniref:exopolysaccharide biosynthesis polyprenyl glycosylphosphotransferase n=1 Tax=Porifericola rhodea TaxID=930972 RepID=UPI00266543A9|nr:exopolysaccharide biosynthesis polyprenyl glycosylphosphotransferase [Porifericola rhodea]WKN32523.1 exopolysaccharide biosynthesis polyprenyl glycosylphosphotransferase [Porifericola rhodea]